MAMGKLGRRGGFGSGAFLGAVGASSFAPYPAPQGFFWDFVIDSENGNQRVIDSESNNQPVVYLVGA